MNRSAKKALDLEAVYSNSPRDAPVVAAFKNFVASLKIVEKPYEGDYEELNGMSFKHIESPDGKWWIEPEPPFHDFNIEGGEEEAGFGIRVDDAFFLVARLPYEFEDLPIQLLVYYLWPDIKRPTFGRYSDYYFREKAEKELIDALDEMHRYNQTEWPTYHNSPIALKIHELLIKYKK